MKQVVAHIAAARTSKSMLTAQPNATNVAASGGGDARIDVSVTLFV